MIAFDVEIDGQPVVLAGVDDWGIYGAHVTAIRADSRDPRRAKDQLHFSIGGMTMHDASGFAHHFNWLRRDLSIGSKVVVTVVETEHPDPPVRRSPPKAREYDLPQYTEEEVTELRRQDYLELKKKFEG